VRNLEHLSPGQFTKVIAALGSDPAGQEVAAAWIGKEKLRHALNLRARVTGSVPGERDVRGRLFAFYDWCAQNDDIPELLSLAKTVSRWENEIVAAVLTGITQFRLRKPEPARQARSPPGIRVPQPGKPAQTRPHRLHPWHTAALTQRHRQEDTPGNRAATRSRLTSKSPITSPSLNADVPSYSPTSMADNF
jgi:hypothetical protein